MLLSGLLLAAPLLAALSSPAGACSPEPARVLWTRPEGADAVVPPDAVLRVLVGEGEVSAGSWTLSLLRRGEVVPATVRTHAWQGSDLADGRLLLALSPDEPLVPGGSYLLEVSAVEGEGSGASVSFTVEESKAAPLLTLPEVEVLSATDEDGAGEAACDWDQVRSFEVDLEPAQGDALGLDVLELYRTKGGAEDELHLVHVLPVDADGSAQRLALRGDRSRDWGSCFVAVQGGGRGSDSEPSPLGCAPEPLQPDDEEQLPADDTGRPAHAGSADDGSCRGCASGGTPVGALLPALLGLLGLGRRRR